MERVTASPTVRFHERTRNGGRFYISIIILSLTQVHRFAKKEQHFGDVMEEGGECQTAAICDPSGDKSISNMIICE